VWPSVRVRRVCGEAEAGEAPHVPYLREPINATFKVLVA
jgi:hypothetical protein